MGISVADLPSLSPLVRDYYFAFDEVREFFNGDFRDSAAYERQMGRLASRKYARARLAEILREQNRSSGCGPRTLQNIEALVQDDACAVVTGQQVALFSGPLYTIYKALTAIKLADSLSQQTGAPVVPIGWPRTITILPRSITSISWIKRVSYGAYPTKTVRPRNGCRSVG